jgi:hypothetical protein
VPTDIYFAQSVGVTVDEDPGEVAEAFAAAGGLPFRLNARGDRGGVYINPATVAFWSAAEPGAQPETQEPPPTTKREVVDLWGNPLRKKRRR